MRSFANLFLVLFFADGCVSLLDGLVSLAAPVALLDGAQNLLADAVVLLALPVYLCLGIDRRLPKRLFLPLILFAVGCPLVAGFYPALAGSRAYGLLAAAVQVVLGLLPLARSRKGERRSLTLPAALFAAPWFGLRNTLAFGAANLLVAPLALALFVLFAANGWLAENTAGFMRLSPGGVSMSERVYRRGSRTIRLAAMIHVGEKAYYDELEASVAPGRTIVLAEGVTDDGNLLRDRLDYGKVAGFLGLTPQGKMLFRGRLVGEEALEAPPPPAQGGKPAPPDVLRADVDVSSFRPPTLLLLNTIGKTVRESRSGVQGLLALNRWGEKNLTPEMQATVMDDILHRRNRAVIHHLEKALDRYDTVVIPWGALHMKEIEEEVLRRGFALQQQRERVSIDFPKLLLGAVSRTARP